MVVDGAIARLKSRVPALGGRVEGAAALAALQARNGFPQTTPAANVIPGGMAGKKVTGLTGLYRQEVDRLFAVILTIRTHDATGARALETLEPLLEAIPEALLGWAPSVDTGVVRLTRHRPLSMDGGTVVWGFDFALDDQLRISP